MWPWGHLAVSYLCFVGYTRLSSDATQTAATLAAVALGSQFPDLIDKTFAWTIPILPSGRSLGHSLLTAILLLAVLRYTITSDELRPVIPAFGIGVLSHSLADLGPGVIGGLLAGDLSKLQWTTYLLWPLLEAPPYLHDESFLQHVVNFALEPYVLFQFGLFGVAIVVWVASGVPGLARVRNAGQQAWAEF